MRTRQVINNTFLPFHQGPIPVGVSQTLIDRFNCKDGYDIHADAFAYIQQLSRSPLRKPGSPNRIIVGVITNSDDRVPDVLTSLGLRVNHLRHGSKVEPGKEAGESRDIDFAIMSYDVGFEKPHRRIFDAATDLVKAMLAAEGRASTTLDDWNLVYVGDEMEKDARGASEAGWSAVVIDRGAGPGNSVTGELPGVSYKRLVNGHEVDVLSDFTAIKNLHKQFPLLSG